MMRRICQTVALFALVAVVGCESSADAREAETARLSAIATADSLRRDLEVDEPFKVVSSTEVDREPPVAFDLRCTDDGQTTVTLMRLSPKPGEAFVTTIAQPNTTRVVWQVDTLPARDSRWIVGGLGDVVAFAPMPVSAAMELRGAKRLRLSYWPYGGDSTELTVDVSRAASRLERVARECRWPT